MTREELAQKIKAKYPDYANIPDVELADRILKKYPEYNAQLDGGVASAPQTQQPATAWKPPTAEEEALQSPDFLPSLIAPENLVAGAGVGAKQAIQAGKGLAGVASEALNTAALGLPKGLKGGIGNFIRGLGAKNIEQAIPVEKAAPVATAIQETVAPVVEGTVSAKDKLLQAIKDAKTPRRKLENIYHAERGKRAGKVGGILSESEGETSYYKALKELKGELAPIKPDYEGIRTKLDQADIDELMKTIHTTSKLQTYEKISATDGFLRMLEGRIPQTKQLGLLRDVFGKDVVTETLKKRHWAYKLQDVITETANIPRAFMTSFDASAPLRQGVILTTSHPVKASRAFTEMFRQAFSPKRYSEWLTNLKSSPNWQLMDDSGLYIADPERAAGLSQLEEKFMTNYASRIPILGQAIKASERAYTSYLNKIRTDVFNQFVDTFAKKGITPEEDMYAFKSLAQFVNSATGRGNMGRLAPSAQLLNATFFSPRLIKARFDFLSPVWYMKQHPEVRKAAIKDFAKFIGTGMTAVGLARAAGAKVETDMRSTDWGKPRIGNTRLDPWGGFQQWAKLFARLATDKRKTSSGAVVPLKEDFPPNSRASELGNFFKYKLAPTPALFLELLKGEKMMGGGELEYKNMAYEKVMPMYMQDVYEAMQEMGPSALAVAAVPAFFGVGVQTYKPKADTF